MVGKSFEGKLLFEFANNIVLGTSIGGNTTNRMLELDASLFWIMC